MDMRHRIVEIKRFILIAGNKIHDQLVHQVRHILLVLQFHLFSVEGVLLPLGLSIPKDSASFKRQILVESKVRWHQG